MAEILNFALVRPVPVKARSAGLPSQFQETIDRHQDNLMALSAALKAAGITPLAAAGYVDAALASFQNGLSAALAEPEEAYRGQY